MLRRFGLYTMASLAFIGALFGTVWGTPIETSSHESPSISLPESIPTTYLSPDGRLTAVLLSHDGKVGHKRLYIRDRLQDFECHVQIWSKPTTGVKRQRLLWSRDFTSPDNQHGRGVVQGQWSPNGRFFVFSTASSGGHSPWHFLTFVYDRRHNLCFTLDNCKTVGPITRPDFHWSGPDTINVTVLAVDSGDTLAGKPIRVRLSGLRVAEKH